MTEINKETIQRIQKSINDGMSDILTEYLIWLRMRELREESEKIKKEMNQTHFKNLLKTEIVTQGRANASLQSKLSPLNVTFHEEPREPKLPSYPQNDMKQQSKQLQQQQKRKAKKEEPEAKRIGRKKKNCVGQLKTEDGMVIMELSSKEIANGQYYILGRGKNKTDKTFIQLQNWTDTRSISHQHAFILFDSTVGLFMYKNIGRNGSTILKIAYFRHVLG